MLFESFTSAHNTLLWSAFGIAVVLGAVVNKTNFCTMGAVSDMVNMGDFGRFRAWLLAIAVAILGVISLEAMGLATPGSAFPPYRTPAFMWAENLLGGVIFGIGMTLASGCGNKTLIRIGGGNLKSIVVLVVIGIIAYFMIYPFPGSDQTLMSVLFLDWLRPLAITLDGPQDLGRVIAGDSAPTARPVIGVLLTGVLLFYIFRSADFRRSADNILAGFMVGIVVIGAWYMSSNIRVTADGEAHTLSSYVQDWDFLVGDSMENMEAEASDGPTKPAESRSLNPQSFTFINPMGQTLGFAARGFNQAYLNFGVVAVLGVICGSLFWSLLSRGFRWEWFASWRDFANHVVGATLMGFGGVLGMGCTIGQGITGVSTLAMGSFVTLLAIILGSTLTMKVQYYRMVYEKEATYFSALIASLADLRLLPKRVRRLDPV